MGSSFLLCCPGSLPYSYLQIGTKGLLLFAFPMYSYVFLPLLLVRVRSNGTALKLFIVYSFVYPLRELALFSAIQHHLAPVTGVISGPSQGHLRATSGSSQGHLRVISRSKVKGEAVRECHQQHKTAECSDVVLILRGWCSVV